MRALRTPFLRSARRSPVSALAGMGLTLAGGRVVTMAAQWRPNGGRQVSQVSSPSLGVGVSHG